MSHRIKQDNTGRANPKHVLLTLAIVVLIVPAYVIAATCLGGDGSYCCVYGPNTGWRRECSSSMDAARCPDKCTGCDMCSDPDYQLCKNWNIELDTDDTDVSLSSGSCILIKQAEGKPDDETQVLVNCNGKTITGSSATSGSGVSTNVARSIRVTDCKFNNILNGIYATNGPLLTEKLTQFSVQGCEFTSVGYPISISNLEGTSQCSITNNVITGGQTGIRLNNVEHSSTAGYHDPSMSIQANTITDTEQYGISIKNSQFIKVGGSSTDKNTIQYTKSIPNGQSKGLAGILVKNSSLLDRPTEVSYNTVSGFGTTSGAPYMGGIVCSDESSCDVEHNVLYSNGQSIMFYWKTCGDISSNTIYNTSGSDGDAINTNGIAISLVNECPSDYDGCLVIEDDGYTNGDICIDENYVYAMDSAINLWNSSKICVVYKNHLQGRVHEIYAYTGASNHKILKPNYIYAGYPTGSKPSSSVRKESALITDGSKRNELNILDTTHKDQFLPAHIHGSRYSTRDDVEITTVPIVIGITRGSTDNTISGGSNFEEASNTELDCAIDVPWGLYAIDSEDNTVENVKIKNCDIGVFLSNSNRTTANNVGVNNSKYGVYMQNSRDNTLSTVVLDNIDYHGIFLNKLSNNNNISSVTINSTKWGFVFLGNSENNRVMGARATTSQQGIYFSKSNNNAFEDVILTGDGESSRQVMGIQLPEVTGNRFTRVNVSNYMMGVGLSDSNDSSFTTLWVFNNSNNGIYLINSYKNEFSDTNVQENCLADPAGCNGIRIYSSGNNTFNGGTVWNNSQIEVYLQGSDGNRIADLTVRSVNESIRLYGSSENTIVDSILEAETVGVNILKTTGSAGAASSGNVVYRNNISLSGGTNYGVKVSDSPSNKITFNWIDGNVNLDTGCETTKTGSVQAHGIVVGSSSHNTEIRKNMIWRTSVAGVQVDHSNSIQVIDNRVDGVCNTPYYIGTSDGTSLQENVGHNSRTSNGLTLSGESNSYQVKDNKFCYNKDAGIILSQNSGSGGGHTITANIVCNNSVTSDRYDIEKYAGSSATGSGNYCNLTKDWTDSDYSGNGTGGCAGSCSAASCAYTLPGDPGESQTGNGSGGGNGGGGGGGGNPGGGGNGGTNPCFLAGTLIETPSTQIPIDKLLLGDTITSFDSTTRKKTPGRVSQLYASSSEGYYLINSRIRVTGEHPFLVDGTWVKARDLTPGMQLFDGVNQVKLESIEYVPEPSQVYNLQVDGLSNYFAEGVLVHNKGGGGNPNPNGTGTNNTSNPPTCTSVQLTTLVGTDPGAESKGTHSARTPADVAVGAENSENIRFTASCTDSEGDITIIGFGRVKDSLLKRLSDGERIIYDEGEFKTTRAGREFNDVFQYKYCEISEPNIWGNYSCLGHTTSGFPTTDPNNLAVVCDRGGCYPVRIRYEVHTNHPSNATHVAANPEPAYSKSMIECNTLNATDPDEDRTEPKTYRWLINDTEIGSVTGRLLNCSAVPECTKSATVKCEITPKDEHNLTGYSFISTILNISNAPPVVESANLTPRLPSVLDGLTCRNGTISDEDDDISEITLGYAWYKNDAVESGLTTSIVTSIQTSAGEIWKCGITPYDGMDYGEEVLSNEVRIGSTNTAPTIVGVTTSSVGGIIPVNVSHNMSFLIDWTDVDGNSTRILVCNTSSASRILGSIQCGDRELCSTTEYDVTNPMTCNYAAQESDKPHNQMTQGNTAYAFVYDGELFSESASTTYYVNHAPTILGIEINPSTAYSDSTLQATNVVVEDPDQDSHTLSYRWFINGTLVEGAGSEGSLSGVFGKTDTVTCEVTSTDTYGLSSSLNSSEGIVVQNSAPEFDTPIIYPVNLRAGRLYVYDANASDADDDLLTYSDDTLLFNIDSTTGYIEFTPNNSDEGYHTVGLTASDGVLYDSMTVYYNITIPNNAPNILSVTDDSDFDNPTTVGEKVAFNVTWADVEGDDAKISVCGYEGCASQEYCNTSEYSNESTLTCNYTTQETDSVTVNYLIQIDDTNGSSQSVWALDGGLEFYFEVNHKPTLDSAPRLSPDPAYADSIIACNSGRFNDSDSDALGNHTRRWFINGSLQATHSANLSCVLNEDCGRGAVVLCEQTPVDGHNLSGAPLNSSTLTISNAPPRVYSAYITPSSPTANDNLTCNNGTVYDADQDNVVLSYRWYHNGTLIDPGDPDFATELLSSAYTYEGEIWKCGITSSDGVDDGAEVTSQEVTISSTHVSPSLGSVSLESGSSSSNPVNVGSNVSFTVSWSDAEGNSTILYICNTTNVTATGCSAQTLCNDTLSDASTKTCSYTVDVLDPGIMTVYVFVCDGLLCSNASSVDVHVNHAPTLSPGPYIVPYEAYSDYTLLCTGGAPYDVDGDSMQSSRFRWFVDGVLVSDANTSNLDESFTRDEEVICEETPVDGHGFGVNAYNSSGLTILNSHPYLHYIGTQYATVNYTYAFQVNASDADDDSMTYSDNIALFDINSTTGYIEFMPTEYDVGDYYVDINVSDGSLQDYERVQFVVEATSTTTTSTSTTSTSTSTTTSTTTSTCPSGYGSSNGSPHPADTDSDCCIGPGELNEYINRWVNGEVDISSLLMAIDIWTLTGLCV